MLKGKSLVGSYLGSLIFFPLPGNSFAYHYVLWTWIIHVLSNKYQKEVYYSGIELFSNISPTISRLNLDIKVFNLALSIS